MIRVARTDRSRRQAGFTLLELLVSLALLGLIAAFAMGGLRLGVRTWETVGTRAEEIGRIQMTRTFLGRELSQAMPLYVADDTGEERTLVYEGERHSLKFVAPLAPHLGLGGLQRFHLAIIDSPDPGSGEKQLVLTRRPYVARDDFVPDLEEDESHLLLEGIAEAEFAYQGDARSGAGGWSADWRGRDDLPVLVRLRVEFADPAIGEWPELVAVRRLNVDPGCVLPIGTPGCRRN